MYTILCKTVKVSSLVVSSLFLFSYYDVLGILKL